MITLLRRWIFASIVVLSCLMSTLIRAQEAQEQITTFQLTEVEEVEQTTVPTPSSNKASTSQRQPISKVELDAAFGQEALVIVNEQLRQELELLAREYRESERRNDIQLFGLGAGVALIFLGIGFLIGKRFGGRRLL